jgi:hypothetical protein
MLPKTNFPNTPPAWAPAPLPPHELRRRRQDPPPRELLHCAAHLFPHLRATAPPPVLPLLRLRIEGDRGVACWRARRLRERRGSRGRALVSSSASGTKGIEAEWACVRSWRQYILHWQGSYCAWGKTAECVSYLHSFVGVTLRPIINHASYILSGSEHLRCWPWENVKVEKVKYQAVMNCLKIDPSFLDFSVPLSATLRSQWRKRSPQWLSKVPLLVASRISIDLLLFED